MTENVLVRMPFRLPADYPWRVRFVGAVDEELRRLRAAGAFRPGRFFGYYFRHGRPVGVSGAWTVTLDATSVTMALLDAIGEATHGQFSVMALSDDGEPDFMLVHDRRDGSCWLWGYPWGLRFVESTEPVLEGLTWDDAQNRKLLP
jgi:hypothetical protein